jgi:hypothetical protein
MFFFLYIHNIKMGKFLNTLFFVRAIQFGSPSKQPAQFSACTAAGPFAQEKKTTPLCRLLARSPSKKTTRPFAQEKKTA